MNWRVLLLPAAGLLLGTGAGAWWRYESHAASAAAFASNSKPASMEEATPEVTPLSLESLQARWDPTAREEDNALAFYEALAGVPAEVLARWLRELPLPDARGGGEERQRHALRCALIDRLLETDPATVAAWLQRKPRHRQAEAWARATAEALLLTGTPESASALRRLRAEYPVVAETELAVLARTDPASALTRLLPSMPLPKECADWLAGDPARAAAHAKTHPGHVAALAEALRAVGGDALRSFAESLTPGKARQAAWRAVAEDLARAGDGAGFAAIVLAEKMNAPPLEALALANPDAATAAIQALAGHPDAVGPGLLRLATTHPALAARLLLDSPDGATLLQRPASSDDKERNPGSAALLSWLTQDRAGALDWVKSLPPEARAGVFSGIGWWQSHSLSATEWLDLTRGLPVGAPGGQIAMQAARLTQDPSVLAEWAASFPEDQRGRMLALVTRQMAGSGEMIAATRMAMETDDLQQREWAIKEIASILHSRPVEAIRQWAASLPPELEVQGLAQVVADRLSYGEPNQEIIADLQARWAAESEATVPRWQPLTDQYTARLTLKAPPAATEAFLSSLPPALRAPALEAAADQLLRTQSAQQDNPRATLDWLGQWQDEGQRREMAALLVTKLSAPSRVAPDTARQVLETLTPLAR